MKQLCKLVQLAQARFVGACLITALLTGVVLLNSHSAYAQFLSYSGPIPNTDFKSGRVMARSIVIDPQTGQPILVEFGKDGREAGVVNVGNVPVDDLAIVPAAEWFFYHTQLDEYREQYKDTLAKDAELLTRREFEQSNFVLADGTTPASTPFLDESVASVLIRGQGNRIIDDPDQLVLLRFGLDLTQQITIPESNASLVVNLDGQIVANSDNTIGYRTGFFGDPNEPQDDRGFRVDPDDTVFGPVKGIKVYVDQTAYRGGVDVTDNDGKYSFRFAMPLCPIGGFTFTTDVWAEMRYKNFLPSGSPTIPYYLRTPGYSYCYASLFGGSSATSSFFIRQSNLYADVMFVSGKIKLKNIDGTDVPLGETTYTTFDQDAEKVTQKFYDFNGDGQADTTIQGRVLECTDSATSETVDIFKPDETTNNDPLPGYDCVDRDPPVAGDSGGNLQGVFFDGRQDDARDFPDLVRLIDRELRDEPIGVLSSVSEDDMRNTDILFFREATGQLILERRGLKQEEAKYRRAVQYDSEENEVAYRVMLRGRNDSSQNVGGGVRRSQSYDEWATEYQLTEPFRTRNSDQPRPGEYIKIVAINRATGYTGTQRVQLKSAGDNGTGLLNVSVPPITLSPPNLRIWAERNYEVQQGLTQGEDRTYTIGNEGAGLTSDTTITIFTEWLDDDGKPLPNELGLDNGEQYGLTGRVAKVVAQNTLQGVAAGSDLAEFPIAPGRKTQVIRIKDNFTTADHFYIHVIGKPKDQECAGNGSSCPSFDNASTQSELAGRPALLTPFLTPLSDEDKYWQEYNEYRRIKDGLADQGTTDTAQPQKPLPAYAWQYRPEYQFSQFDLELNELARTYTDENGDQQLVDILDLDNPTIASSDDYITALYSLISSEFGALSPIDGGRELVFALGEQEQRITLGEDQSVRFSDISSLAGLDAEDFLSIRLYSNNDAGNVLWEYAFGFMSILPSRNSDLGNEDNEMLVTADDVDSGPLNVALFLNPEGIAQPINWRQIGNGAISQTRQVSESGVYSTSLTLPPKLGNSSVVKAFFDDESVSARTPIFRVVAGSPGSIVADKTGNTVIGGLGAVEVELEVKDKFGNYVVDGTLISVDAPFLKVSPVEGTKEGKVVVTFVGTGEAGLLPVKFKVGGIVLEETINVHDVTLEFTNVSDVPIGQTTDFGISAESSYGDLSGLTLDVAVHRGRLSTNSVTIGSDNTATVDYESGRYRGFAQFSTKISETEKILTETFTVTETNSSLSRDVLVTDGTGSIDLDNGLSINYSNTTNLVISAAPGEEVRSSLLNIFKPPLYALLDYNQDLPQTRAGKVIDLSSGIDASLSGVDVVEAFSRSSSFAYNLPPNASIEVPDHPRLEELSDAGVNFGFKIPDLSAINSPFEILDWDGMGLKLSLAADGSLLVSGEANGQPFSIVHTTKVQAQTWHQVAIHFVNGELRFGIDGVLVEQSIAGQLLKNQSDFNLKIENPGPAQTPSIQVESLKLYDWQGERKMMYADGSLEATAIADQNGFASIAITASDSQIAYTRPYAQHPSGSFLFAYASDLIIPAAHAQADPLTQCKSSFVPVSENAPDVLIAKAEQFFDMILECFVKPKVEEVQIDYETSSGFFNRTALLVKADVYEGVYELLKRQKSNSIMLANCLDAVFTGLNSSAVGAGCNFVTSLLAIGDLRDLIFQGWHYYIGDRVFGGENYDPLITALSAIGLLADVATATGVGAGIGIPINALAAAGKPVARALRLAGPNGIRAARIVGNELERIVRGPGTVAQKWEKLKRFAPVIEVFAAVAVIQQSNPELFEFLVSAVTSIDTFSNIGSWLVRYLDRLEMEAGLAHSQINLLSFFINEANAALSDGIRRRLIKELTELVEGAKKVNPAASADEIAEALNNAVGIYNRVLNDFALKNVKDGMLIVRAFTNLSLIGGPEAVRRLAYRGGYTLGIPELGNTALVKAVAEVDFNKLIESMGEPAAKKGFNNVVNQIDSTIFNFSKGGIAHLLVILDLLKTPGVKILNIEEYIPAVKIGDNALPRRRPDLIIEAKGQTIVVDVKNFQSTTWRNNFAKMMSFNAVSKNGVNEAGQLFQDIVNFMKKGNKGHKYILMPDAQATPDQVIDHIETLMKQADNSENLRLANEFTGSRQAWEKKLDDTIDAMQAEEFIQISGLSNLAK